MLSSARLHVMMEVHRRVIMTCKTMALKLAVGRQVETRASGLGMILVMALGQPTVQAAQLTWPHRAAPILMKTGVLVGIAGNTIVNEQLKGQNRSL